MVTPGKVAGGLIKAAKSREDGNGDGGSEDYMTLAVEGKRE